MQSVVSWLRKPYSPDMDVLHWVYFVVLILIIAAGWAHTLNLLTKAVK